MRIDFPICVPAGGAHVATASRFATAARFATAVLLAMLPALLTPAGALARPKADARVQEILDGNELYVDQKQAKLNQLAYRPELISTKESRGSLAFSTGAQARISKNSQLRLGSDCARLSQAASK